MTGIIAHDNRAAASTAAADLLARALRAQLSAAPEAVLVVSGGSTPGPCLDALSTAELSWGSVAVTLTDERQVPATDPASNEAMVRHRLLVGPAAAARFVPVEASALAALPRPYACVLVGMGEDGHFASLFPDACNLAEGLDLDNPAPCIAVRTSASPLPRVSMTLSWLVQSNLVVLLAFGAEKRRVLDAPENYPVGRLLAQTRVPVRVVWAP